MTPRAIPLSKAFPYKLALVSISLALMPPDAVKFREYYNQGLEEAMLEETYRFTAHALRMNVF